MAQLNVPLQIPTKQKNLHAATRGRGPTLLHTDYFKKVLNSDITRTYSLTEAILCCGTSDLKEYRVSVLYHKIL